MKTDDKVATLEIELWVGSQVPATPVPPPTSMRGRGQGAQLLRLSSPSGPWKRGQCHGL